MVDDGMAAEPACKRRDASTRAWLAVGGGIAAGFMLLASLWLMTQGDHSTAAILAACAAVMAAIGPTALNRR